MYVWMDIYPTYSTSQAPNSAREKEKEIRRKNPPL